MTDPHATPDRAAYKLTLQRGDSTLSFEAEGAWEAVDWLLRELGLTVTATLGLQGGREWPA